MCICDDPAYNYQEDEIARKNVENFLGKPITGWVHPDWALGPDVKKQMRDIIEEFEHDRHI